MSTINLLPKDYLLRRVQYRANMICASLFGIVITAILAAGLVSEHHMRRTLQVHGRVNAAYAKATSSISQMRQLELKKKDLLRKAENTASLVEHVPRSYMLAVTTNALPRRAALVRFSLDTRQVIAKDAASRKYEARKKKRTPGSNRKGTGKTLSETHSIIMLEIIGLARTDVEVSRFMSNLESNGLIDWVDLDYSELKVVNDEDVRQFKIRAQLKTDVDVVDVLPQRKPSKLRVGSKRYKSTFGGAL